MDGSLLIILPLVLLLLTMAGCLLSAWNLLRPPRMSDGKAIYLLKRLSPGDLGIGFEIYNFKVRDHRTGQSIHIAGWWMPHPAGGDKTVVLIHGYADAKVGAIAWVPVWRELGFHILAIDLRAHGESGGRYTTAGVFERHDLDQVLNQFIPAHPQQTRHIVLFGISMGAAVALATAAIRDDISAVVLECPFADFTHAVKSHARQRGSPLLGLLPASLRIAQWMSGADFNTVRPVDLLSQVKCPVMIIQSGDDALVPPDDAAAIESACRARGLDRDQVWQVADAPHLRAFEADPDVYREKIRAFLNSAASTE